MINEKIRNIAIIAHVDHGKTSIVNEMLKQGNVFRENQVVEDRVMDSNALERERGITILSKNASCNFNGIKIKQLAGYKNVREFEISYLSKCEFLKIQRVYDDIIKYHTIEIPTTKEYRRVLKDKVIYFDKNGNVVASRSEIDKYLSGDETAIIEEHKYLDNPGAYRYGLRMLLNSEYKLEWIRDFLDGYDKRVVIFYNYNVELQSLKELLEKMKRPYSVYNGEEKSFENFKNNETL